MYNYVVTIFSKPIITMALYIFTYLCINFICPRSAVMEIQNVNSPFFSEVN
jgi:hypothetical protein